MTQTEQQRIKRWVETWKRADSALNKIRRQELRAYDYRKNLKIIDDMLQWACDHAKVRISSGLVEQQRLFMKLRKRHYH